nr:hypothetical protein [Mycoplasmoides genitalium]
MKLIKVITKFLKIALLALNKLGSMLSMLFLKAKLSVEKTVSILLYSFKSLVKLLVFF